MLPTIAIAAQRGSGGPLRRDAPAGIREEDDMAKRSTKKTKTATKRTATKKTATKKKSARKPNAAFMRPVNPSPALAEVVGAKPVPRTEITKRLWAYIKKNKLQDAKNKRMIKADGALKPVFGGKSSVNMFEMTRLVNKHLS
jgi:upstream activation factor subunit UAF30